ncbi:uncharacterized protein [Halyomorpha halys]|uniref:uncharacterized protein n=1 Tax=Halyomorpha halys TaxID=286706 RepID=UPI0006D512DA|nr:uncharacterized protein LOC106685943 [Halyomorpha halys]
MFLAFAILSVLLCSVQGDGVDPDINLEAQLYMKEHKQFLGKMKGWLTDMTKSMILQVETTNQNFQELPNTLMAEGKAQLALHYAQTMQELMGSSAPQHCIAAGQQELSLLQANNLNSFLTCKNMTTGLKDILQMGLEISKLTIQIITTADEVINGFGSCSTWNVFKFFYCTFNWVKDSIGDIYKSFQAVTDFTKNMGILVADLKSQIDYCMHGSKATALMDHVQVLTNVQKCAAKSQ